LESASNEVRRLNTGRQIKTAPLTARFCFVSEEAFFVGPVPVNWRRFLDIVRNYFAQHPEVTL
jgi:hypothetical protein